MMRIRGALFFVVMLLALSARAWAGSNDGRLDIYWVDVEGGAATLLVTPQGESVLVDSGNPGRRDATRIFDVAAKVAGLTQIDHLVTTHYHRDHFGGAAMLDAVLPIRRVYDNGEFPAGRERPDKEYLDFQADERAVINPGDVLPLAAGPDGALPVSVRCLATRQEFCSPAADARKNSKPDSRFKPKDRDDTDNANSVVLLVTFGDFQFFDAGDLTWNVEYGLIHPFDLVGQVDVYQVTHHGLDQSNNNLLIESLAPAVAIMNNGVTKGCEPETFATLSGLSSLEAMYQMHKNLRDDGVKNNTSADQIANLEENCPANYIRLSVAADGESYTVSIPATGHERNFATK